MELLVLQDKSGTTLRTFSWAGEKSTVIRREDSRRLEIVADTADLVSRKIHFENLGEITKESLARSPYILGELGHLRLTDKVGQTVTDVQDPKESQRAWYLSIGLLVFLFASMISSFSRFSQVSPKLEEELKKQVVKIIKNIQRPETQKALNKKLESEPTTKQVTKSVSVKRLGALSALGSLTSGKQKAGLNLGAAQTSAGPGLGGTQGSGGVQTSLYAKGIVASPLGAGGNIQGAGGYGTKGKGGGQAGYGKLALTGSSGASPMALGNEASVAQGLDKDMIAAVIARNLGQVRFCYEQGLQGDSSLAGRVVVDFTIGGNGLVKSASVGSSSLHSAGVEECIVMRLKTWKFPLPDGGVDVKVSYPFQLRRSGQG